MPKKIASRKVARRYCGIMGVWVYIGLPNAALALSGFSFCINGLAAQFASLHFHCFEAGLRIVAGCAMALERAVRVRLTVNGV